MSILIPSLRSTVAVPSWAKNELWRRARAVPSLDQRFAESKSLIDAVSGQQLITFTRASEGTVVNSAGQIEIVAANVPRFDHDPVTGESLGLLPEEQRTNLLLRSEEFDNASWTKVAVTVSANATAAPNGTTTADKLIINNGESAGYAAQSLSFTSGTTWTASCFVKAGEVSDFRFVFEAAAFGSNLNAVFNLSTGVVASFTAGSASIQALPNGWYRCIATATTTATASASIQFRSVHAGNGTDGIFVWGAQLEAGAFATSVIPTSKTAVTRSADVASITGDNFSRWYRQDEGTFNVRTGPAPSLATTNYLISVSSGSFENGIFVAKQLNNQATARIRVANADTFTNIGDGIAWPGGVERTLALAYSAASGRFATQGILTGSDQLISQFPAPNRIDIGSLTGNGFFFNGPIRRLCFFPQRLPNSTLQNITL